METNEIKLKSAKITFDIGVADFEYTMGRKPKNQEELDKFGNLMNKGIEAQLDWGILNQCTKEEMDRDETR